MSLARHTSINLPGGKIGHGGLGEWGRKSRVEMIAIYRRWAERQKAEAERILAAPDEDFVVQTYLGEIRRKNVEVVTE